MGSVRSHTGTIFPVASLFFHPRGLCERRLPSVFVLLKLPPAARSTIRQRIWRIRPATRTSKTPKRIGAEAKLTPRPIVDLAAVGRQRMAPNCERSSCHARQEVGIWKVATSRLRGGTTYNYFVAGGRPSGLVSIPSTPHCYGEQSNQSKVKVAYYSRLFGRLRGLSAS